MAKRCPCDRAACRPGQRTCKACHAAYMVRLRRKQRAELATLRARRKAS